MPRERLRGTIQTDILKEYIAQKEYIFPPEPSMRLVTDMVEFTSKEMPLWHPISISGYHIREAGSTAAQELAFTLADGFTYVEWAIERGLDVDDFAPRLSFFFNAHLDFFEEIAKYRAARRIWATLMREKYGAKDPRSWLMRFHTQTAGVSLTAQQPEVNLVRTAIEALAAVLGGTQSLHTNSFDEALALPTEHAVRLALRTQQVIAHETGVVNTIDPLGGSYYVEHLTNELERQAYEYFDQIEKLGGVVEAIKENFFQREIAEASFQYQSEVESKQRIVVGVNKYVLEDEQPIEILKVDAALEQEQIERVRELKGAPRLGRGRGGTRPPQGRCRSRRREPDGPDHRRLPRARHDGRDVRHAPRRLGHLARDARLLGAKARDSLGAVARRRGARRRDRRVRGDAEQRVVSASTPPPPHRAAPLTPAERRLASEFLDTAVARKRLGRAWEIVAPELKQGTSLDEWKTGSIPVVPYPVAKATALMRVVNSFTDRARLRVTFVPDTGTSRAPGHVHARSEQRRRTLARQRLAAGFDRRSAKRQIDCRA